MSIDSPVRADSMSRYHAIPVGERSDVKGIDKSAVMASPVNANSMSRHHVVPIYERDDEVEVVDNCAVEVIQSFTLIGYITCVGGIGGYLIRADNTDATTGLIIGLVVGVFALGCYCCCRKS